MEAIVVSAASGPFHPRAASEPAAAAAPATEAEEGGADRRQEEAAALAAQSDAAVLAAEGRDLPRSSSAARPVEAGEAQQDAEPAQVRLLPAIPAPEGASGLAIRRLAAHGRFRLAHNRKSEAAAVGRDLSGKCIRTRPSSSSRANDLEVPVPVTKEKEIGTPPSIARSANLSRVGEAEEEEGEAEGAAGAWQAAADLLDQAAAVVAGGPHR